MLHLATREIGLHLDHDAVTIPINNSRIMFAKVDKAYSVNLEWWYFSPHLEEQITTGGTNYYRRRNSATLSTIKSIFPHQKDDKKFNIHLMAHWLAYVDAV